MAKLANALMLVIYFTEMEELVETLSRLHANIRTCLRKRITASGHLPHQFNHNPTFWIACWKP